MRYLAAATFLFAFFLPLNTRVSNLFLILLLLISLIYSFRNKPSVLVGKKWKMLIYTMAPFFLLHIMGSFFTDYPENSYKFIARRISYLLVPIIFIFFNYLQLKQIETVFLKGLLFGTVISILVLLGLNFFTYFTAKETFSIGADLFDYYHTYHNFTKPIDIHPTYLGTYFLTVLIFLDRIVTRHNAKILLIVLFFVAFLFLNSRIVLFGVFLWVVFTSGRKVAAVFRRGNYLRLIAVGCFVSLVLFLSIKFLSKTYIGFRLKNMYQFEFSTDNEKNFNYRNKSNPRMARYISTLNLIKKRPFFGYGIADETSNLKAQFTEDGLLYAAKENYNSHNQFLGYAVRFGVLGVLSLLFFFILNIRLALEKRDYSFLLFLCFIVCVNLVENYFDRNFGITFSVVFFTILSYKNLLDLETGLINE